MAAQGRSRKKSSVLLSGESDLATFSLRIPAGLAREVREIRRQAKQARLQFPVDQILAGQLQKIAEQARSELDFHREQLGLELREK